MESILLEKKDKPKELFTELHRIWREELNQEKKSLPSTIIKLNKENNIDFCLLAVEAINDNFGCFDVASIFEEPLSDMNLNVSSVLRLAETLYDGMQNDLLAGRQFKPLEDLAIKQPEFARSLLTELLKQDKPYIVGYISKLYQAFSKNNEHKIHSELCSQKNHKSKYVLIAIADALGELNYEPSDNKKLVTETINVFLDLESKNIEEINRILIFAYANLLEQTDQANDKIIQFSQDNTLLIQGACSQVLFRLQSEYGNEKWFSQALLNLQSVSCQNIGIIENIDFILSELINKNNNWELAENFFATWILKSDVNLDDKDLAKLFDSTFLAFINNREHFEGLLTNFLNHDSPKIHKAVSKIASYCKVHKIENLTLNKKILKGCSENDIVYICQKILGYVFDGEHLCSLCFSILEAFPTNKMVKGLVYDILKNYIGQDHPGIVLDFLKNKSKTNKSRNKQEVIDGVIKDIEEYYKRRDSLPKLKEMAASKQKSRSVFKEQNKKMGAAMEEAQKDSIINMIASKVVLKQGTGWFNYYEEIENYGDISKLGSFSTTMTIPHSEVTHPVDAAIQRFHFRQAKRGQK